SSVVLADFRFHLIWDLVAQLESQSDPGLQIFLTDPSGAIIAHANPTIVFKRTVYKAPAQDGQTTGLDGNPALVTKSSLSLGNLQFTVIGEEPVATALKDARDAALSAAVIALLGFLLAIGVILVVARQIVQPIEQLSQVAETIRGGDF